MNNRRCEVVFLSEAEKFLMSLPLEVQKKIVHNVGRIQEGEQNVELFKKLAGTDIWELRTLYKGIAYRFFAFWDKRADTLVVSTHGIIKKTQKTPSKEIAKAIRIMKQYFETNLYYGRT